MKKILWVCNVPIPRIANDIGVKPQNICGWLTGFANLLELNKEIELHVCFPILGLKEIHKGKVGNISYYAFSQPKLLGFLPVENQLKTSTLMENHIDEIIKIVDPDILHIFGTEYPHSLVATQKFNNPNKTVVNIQGLTSIYANHFNSGIPYKVLKKFSISNIVRGNLLKQAKKMEKRGYFEVETIKSINHVIGRTDWDEACTIQINPQIRYHFCNESLRDSFYSGKWNYNNCKKNSIFMSQAATPIKGLQYMIQALPEIIKEFPETHLYIAGNDITKTDSIYEKLKISSFALYIKSLIKKNNLESKVTFLGPLNEYQMKLQYLNSNVFVSPSTIENSPNSLGEAMLLGVPCVASDVGGIKNLIVHNQEGFVYQMDAPYMLAFYVKKYFKDIEMTNKFSNEAIKHANKTHDRVKNLEVLLDIYKEIMYE